MSDGQQHTSIALLSVAKTANTRVSSRPFYLDFARVELPLCFAVEGGHVHSPWDEAVAAAEGNSLEWPLNAVKNGGQQTGT